MELVPEHPLFPAQPNQPHVITLHQGDVILYGRSYCPDVSALPDVLLEILCLCLVHVCHNVPSTMLQRVGSPISNLTGEGSA